MKALGATTSQAMATPVERGFLSANKKQDFQISDGRDQIQQPGYARLTLPTTAQILNATGRGQSPLSRPSNFSKPDLRNE